MKTGIKLLIWLSLLTSSPLCLYSQTRVIELDFNKKDFNKNPYKESIKEGNLYQLKIMGINMNLYKVVVEGKDSTKVNPPSIPLFDSFNLEPLTNLITGLKSFNISTENIFDNKASITKGNEEKSKIDHNKLQTICNQMKSLSSINDQIDTLKNINLKIDNLKQTVFKKRLSYLVEDTLKPFYKMLKGNFKFDFIISKSNAISSSLNKIMIEISGIKNVYDSFYSINKIVIDSIADLNKLNVRIQETFAVAQRTCENLFKTIDADKINEWFSSIIHFENNSKREYLSLPMQHISDFSTLKIRIIPKFNEYPTYETMVTFTGQPNFYVGIGTSFYSSNMYNDAYSIKATVKDSVNTDYSIVNESPRKREIGIATLLHFGWNLFNSNFGIHGSIGPAISISTTVKPRLAVGAGISYGRRQKLTFNVLRMAGYVDRRSNNFAEDSIYSSKPENITVSKLSFGWGFSFGYIYKF